MSESDAKTEYLEVLLKKQEIIKQVTDGCNQVVQGGIEGIQLAALQQPELIINAITSLGYIVESQQKEHLALVEQHFELKDSVDELTDLVQEYHQKK
jgi:hypothetical protein